MKGNTIEVFFENSLRQIELKGNMTLQDLLERLEIKEADPYWVACNRKMIRKSDFSKTVLKPRDRVEILRILSGGSQA